MFALYTGCVKSTGTTFGGQTEPPSDLTKKILNAKRKIFNKSSYDYKIYFLRNHFLAQNNHYPAETQMHLACLSKNQY